MDIANAAIAALAAPAPARPPVANNARQQLAIASIRRNAPAASHAMEHVANALWMLRSDIRNEQDALLLTDAIATIEDVIARFAEPVAPAPAVHPVGRFPRDDVSCRGGE